MVTDIGDLQTFRAGPFWLLSALTGQPSPGPDERRMCEEALGSLANGFDPAVAHLLLDVDDEGAVRPVAADDRSVATGLTHIAMALRRLDADTAANYRRALLTFGFTIAKAHGPFGRSITPEDGLTLVVCASLVDHTGAPLAVALAA
jgi:hypothetical protein